MKDQLLLREVLTIEPFLYKAGSKDAGKKWTEVADKLNCYSLFKEMPRDQRSVREHFNKMIGEYKKKMKGEEEGSGISPDPPTECGKLLEEIIEIMDSTPIRVENSESKKQEKRRKEALACRDLAMTTWAKARKSGGESDTISDEETVTEQKPTAKRARKRRQGSDAFQYLAERSAKEAELKKEELELRKEELRIQAEQQREQLNLQQEQMKQMMQSQMQTQNLMVAFLERLGK